MLCEGLLSIILRRGVVSGARPSTLGGRISGPLRTVRGIWSELPCELPAELPWELPAELRWQAIVKIDCNGELQKWGGVEIWICGGWASERAQHTIDEEFFAY